MSLQKTGKKPWYERIPNTFVILFALIVLRPSSPGWCRPVSLSG